MAITAYVGIPRSGKSYEVVSSVIVEQFKKGRRIVTNIVGISEQALIEYCLKDKTVKDGCLGTLIKVTDDDCIRDDFFPYKGSTDTICKAGDLICLDEIWRLFPNDNIKANHRSFVAEHGHFTDPETGICCDLVVINQSVSGIPRFIKERIETTYLMSRLLALGMPNRYRVNVYTGAKITKAGLVAQYQNRYNKDIFKLYKSFDGLNGKQISIDDRQNFFKSGTFKLLVFSIIAMFSFSYYLLEDILFKSEPKTEAQSKPAQQEQKRAIQSSNDDFSQMLNEAKQQDIQQQQASQTLSANWRITGELMKNGHQFVVLVDDKGNLRLEPRRFFKHSGRALIGTINGETVSYYSGVMRNEKIIN